MRGYLLAGLCITVAGGLLAGGCGGGGGEPKEFVLGAVLPLNGPDAQTGREMLNGIQLAAQGWNSRGQLRNWTCVVVGLDDSGVPEQAVSSARALCSGHPNLAAVCAHLSGDCFLATSKIFHDHRVASISPGVTDPQITLQGLDNVFRVCSTDAVQARAAVDIFKKLGFKSVALSCDEAGYGQVEAVEEGCLLGGIEVTTIADFRAGHGDFGSIVSPMRASKPDAVYFSGFCNDGGLLVREMRKQGMEQPFFGGGRLKSAVFTDVGGTATVGSRVSIPGPPIETMSSGPAGDFLKNYESEFGVKAEDYGPLAYDAANILLAAISTVLSESGDIDREAIIAEVKRTEHDGVTGHITFDANGDTTNRTVTFYEVIENSEGKLRFKPYETARP